MPLYLILIKPLYLILIKPLFLRRVASVRGRIAESCSLLSRSPTGSVSS